MNEQARASVDALREQMPKHRGIVCLVVFGSQARGDERPDSDLDVLCVVGDQYGGGREERSQYRDMVLGIIGGATDATVLVETPASLRTSGSLYGTAAYRALREGMVVWGGENMGLVHTHEMAPAEAAWRWLALSYIRLERGRQMERVVGGGALSSLGGTWASSVEFALNAALCYRRVRFPFVRGDLRRLHGMLPDGEAVHLGGGTAPGRRDAERVYGSVRVLLGDGGPWDVSDMQAVIAALESLRPVPAGRAR